MSSHLLLQGLNLFSVKWERVEFLLLRSSSVQLLIAQLNNNVLVLTNVTTGQIIILCHRQNLWMGKSFRGSKSTFHLWELSLHVLLWSQMDARGVAFKSTGSGKKKYIFECEAGWCLCFGLWNRLSCFVETNYSLFMTSWFTWETLSCQLPQLQRCCSL